MSSNSSTTNETTRSRSRIVFPHDNDDDDDSSSLEDVISIHSSSSSSNSSSSMEDFDTLWEQHVQKTSSHGGDEEDNVDALCLATQPVATCSTTTTTTTSRLSKTTSATSTSTLKFKENNTTKSLEMTAFTSKQDGHPSAARVSLSPQKQQDAKTWKPKRHVTMREQVVTGAVATNTTNTNEEEHAKSKGIVEKNPMVKKDSSVSKKKSLEPKQTQNKGDVKSVSDSSKKTSDSKEMDHKRALSSSKDNKSLESKKKKKKRKKDSANATVSTSTSLKSNKETKHKSPESTLVAKNPPQQQFKQDKPLSERKNKTKTKDSKPVTSFSKNDKAAAPTTATTMTSGNKRKSSATPTTCTTKPPPLKKPKRTFQDALLLKMLLSCKPYTLKTCAHAMGSTEAAIHHVMLSLVDKGIVVKKEFSSKNGRTKELYWANQSSTAKQVQTLELPSREEMVTVQQEFASFRTKHSLYSRELQMVEQEPSNEQLDKQLVEMEQAVSTTRTQLQDTKNRIAAFKQNGESTEIQNPLVLKKRINHMRDEWKDRKTKCRDFVDQLADGLEKPIKAVVKLLELETDEMEGVTMPPKYDVKK